MSKDKIIARTGHPVPKSGQYRPVGGNSEYTFSEGIITPPNRDSKRQEFVLVDVTKHKK